jgi:hypothetical protein
LSGSSNSKLDAVWRLSLRWAQYRGEYHVGLLRVLFVASGLVATCFSAAFHWQLASVLTAWLIWSGIVLLVLSKPCFPRWLPAGLAVLDGLLLTSVLCLFDYVSNLLGLCHLLLISVALFRVSIIVLWTSAFTSIFGFLADTTVMRLSAHLINESWHTLLPSDRQIVMLVAMVLTAIAIHRLLYKAKYRAINYIGRLEVGIDIQPCRSELS